MERSRLLERVYEASIIVLFRMFVMRGRYVMFSYVFFVVTVVCSAELQFGLFAIGDEPIQSLVSGSMKLQPSLIGSGEHAQKCGHADASEDFIPRLEVLSESPMALRVGVECVKSHGVASGFTYGNVWLDQRYSVPFALSAFKPSASEFEGHILIPTLREDAVFDRRNATFKFTEGVSAGRIIQVRNGSGSELSQGSDPSLPSGEHILQLTASCRFRDDSDGFRRQSAAVRQELNDIVHCRSEAVRIHVRDRTDKSPDAAKDTAAMLPRLNCTLRFVGLPPKKVGDPATIEVVLDNIGDQPLQLIGPCFSSGLSGWAPLIREASEGEQQMKWDLSCLLESQYFQKGGAECVGKKPSGFRVTLPANCFIASKFHCSDWKLAGDYSLKVQYSNVLLHLNYPERTNIDDPQLPRPASKCLRFSVSN